MYLINIIKQILPELIISYLLKYEDRQVQLSSWVEVETVLQVMAASLDDYLRCTGKTNCARLRKRDKKELKIACQLFL